LLINAYLLSNHYFSETRDFILRRAGESRELCVPVSKTRLSVAKSGQLALTRGLTFIFREFLITAWQKLHRNALAHTREN